MRGRTLLLAGALVVWPALLADSTNPGAAPSGVERLYRSSSGQPIWVRGNSPTPQALKMIGALKDAASEGLDPLDYDGPLWDARLAALRTGAFSLSLFDSELSVAVLRYASNRRFGRANPNPAPDADMAEWVFQRLAASNDPEAALPELDPPFEGYRRLRTALATYQRLARQGAGEMQPALKKPVEPGAPRHGASPKAPSARRVRQLQLSMERWRWLPRDQPGPYIVVNVPEFRLRALDASGKTELSMKVVVGKARGLRTPNFSADMNYLIFRPYWNVPSSIQHKELIPEIESDASYLARNDFEVTDSAGHLVSRGGVSSKILEGLRRGELQVRQRPGASNALGGVKFVLPNPHDVYLHDTPAKRLFAHARRDFSHGCIRLEKAADLAAWVLGDRPEWTRQRILAAMSGGAPTVRVNLSHPIPVHIVYQTAVAGEDGKTYFFDDIYGLDEALDRQFTSAGPGPHPRG